MAQLVVVHENLAKSKVTRGIRSSEAEDHAIQAIGDVAGVFEDDHQFSLTEQELFEIIPVSDCTRDQFRDAMPIPERAPAFKAETIEWSFDRPEEKETWKDKNHKWYFLEKRPKFLLSIANLTVVEKQDLIDKPFLAKISIIKKFKNRIKDYPANFIEVTDLNK